MSHGHNGNGRRPQEPQDQEIDRLLGAYKRGRRVAGRKGRGDPQFDEEEEFRRRFDSFARLGPPQFLGDGGYRAAEEWLAAIKSRLAVCHAPPDRHVGLASYYLTDTARFWWDDIKRGYEGDVNRIPWEWFEEHFGRRFLSTMHREAMRSQFVNLRQRDRSVAEYNGLFLTWAKYAPDICNDAFRYRRQYLNGLDPDIALAIDNRSYQGVQSLMDAAEQAEAYRKTKAQIKGKQNQRGRGGGGKNKRSPAPANRSNNTPYERVWCRRCQLPHAESQC